MKERRPRTISGKAVGTLAVVALVVLGAWLLLWKVLPADPPVGDINVQQAQTLLKRHHRDPNFIVLDVRTPQEYAQGYISTEHITPVNLDFHAADFREQLAKLDRAKTYLVYCRTGNRSAQAMELMRELGFARIYTLQGGIMAWNEATPD